jgi:hypothetical protein
VPSTSKKQHNFMAAVAKNPKFAKKAGVPQSVGEDFLEADKGKKFRRGGTTNPMRAGINKQKTRAGMLQMPNASLTKFRGFNEGGETMKPVNKEENPGLAKLPTDVRNKMGYMKKGGMAHSDMAKDKPMMKAEAAKAVKGHEKRMHGMAKGGVTRADGIVKKGHTKGTMVKMARGGKC